MNINELQVLEPNQEKKVTKRWLYLLLILGILVLLSVCGYLIYSSNDFYMIDRKEWGAVEPLKKVFLSQPVQNVVIDENPFECDTKETCISYMKDLQRYRIESHILNDIDSNFFIGGDGQIYEGTGWHINPISDHSVTYIVICVFGKFDKVEPPSQQVNAIQRLMAEGMRLGNLNPDYHVYSRHQIDKSGGFVSKLYDLMQKWPRFSKDLGLLHPKNEDKIKL